MPDFVYIGEKVMDYASQLSSERPSPLKSPNAMAVLDALRRYEEQYVKMNCTRREAWESPKLSKSARNTITNGINLLSMIVEQLEDVEDYVWASQLCLLGCLIGDGVDYYTQNLWERALGLSRVTDGYFYGDSFFYKIAGDIFACESETSMNGGTAPVNVISFTPLLFLPNERFSMARIYAFKRMIGYLEACRAMGLQYLFCDITARQEIQKLKAGELSLTKEVVSRFMAGNSHASLKYFVEGYGLRSCVMGNERGVIQEGAEIHPLGPMGKKEVLVREIRGAVLERERTCFDELFCNPLQTYSIGTPYLKVWKLDPEDYLFARNEGIYSKAEQRKLQEAKVAIVGLGCIGGVVAQALTRMGVQCLTLIDGDVVEPENINRQPYATFNTIGQPKTDVTIKELRKINSKANPVGVTKLMDPSNALEIVKDVDVIVQCVDEMSARILIHRIAKECHKPVVTMSGQPPYRGFVSTFLPDGPGYEDVMGFEKEVTDIPTEQLCSEASEAILRQCKLKRAAKALEHASVERKSILTDWYRGYCEGMKGWAVTFERTWLMGVIQAHEVVRLITMGPESLLAAAPKAVIVDLSDIKNVVRVASPLDGDRWAVDKHWDYTNF